MLRDAGYFNVKITEVPESLPLIMARRTGTSRDPFEFTNLTGDPHHQTLLKELREHLDRWMVETADMGDQPEPDEAKNATQGRKRRSGGGSRRGASRRVSVDSDESAPCTWAWRRALMLHRHKSRATDAH
jgi:hypothetical protein